MSTKKIRHYEARSIASKIADKAFEHLLTPFLVKEAELAKSVYSVLDERHDFLQLAEIGLMQRSTQVQLAVRMEGIANDDTDITLWAKDNTEDDDKSRFFAPRGYHSHAIVLHDNRMYDIVSQHRRDMQPFVDRHDALENELRRQIDGKTVTQALKAWPEAASFIAEVCEVNTTPMTIPVEQLLAKFLLMLPAPQSEGVPA